MNTQTYPNKPMRRRGDVFRSDAIGALRNLVDVVRRRDADYVMAHQCRPASDEDLGRALCRAEDALDELDGRL
jgi:hypothetical protein